MMAVILLDMVGVRWETPQIYCPASSVQARASQVQTETEQLGFVNPR
jgi:hypothetical protein